MAIKFYIRYSDNIKKDIRKGYSMHYTDFDKKDFKTAKELAEALDIEDPETVIFNKDSKTWVQKLPGLCAFELEADNLEDAIEEAKQFEYNSVYNSEDMPFWHILEGEYIDDCPEGEVIEVINLLYSNKIKK